MESDHRKQAESRSQPAFKKQKKNNEGAQEDGSLLMPFQVKMKWQTKLLLITEDFANVMKHWCVLVTAASKILILTEPINHDVKFHIKLKET